MGFCYQITGSTFTGSYIFNQSASAQRGFSIMLAIMAANIAKIGRPNMESMATAGISISFMVFLLLKGLIRGQTKGMRCYNYLKEAE